MRDQHLTKLGSFHTSPFLHSLLPPLGVIDVLIKEGVVVFAVICRKLDICSLVWLQLWSLTTQVHSRERRTAWSARCRRGRARSPARGERCRSGRRRTWRSRWGRRTWGGGRTGRTRQWGRWRGTGTRRRSPELSSTTVSLMLSIPRHSLGL